MSVAARSGSTPASRRRATARARAGLIRRAVIVVSLAGTVSSLFLAAHRSLPPIGEVWTDGVSLVPGSRAESARRIVWKRPQPLALEGPQDLRGLPVLEAAFADDRTVLFSAGTPGRNTDLYAGDLVGERVERIRPLRAVDSPYDERAPAFDGSFLYFASDRPDGEGGLDLYRAPWNGGELGNPVPLTGVNSSADDTDPAPRPGGSGLVFASDRE